jgi:hypothetical protein
VPALDDVSLRPQIPYVFDPRARAGVGQAHYQRWISLPGAAGTGSLAPGPGTPSQVCVPAPPPSACGARPLVSDARGHLSSPAGATANETRCDEKQR